MRGEENARAVAVARSAELPPHARRRAQRSRRLLGAGGITSACAEKSCDDRGITLSRRELPPHARRRGVFVGEELDGCGITSACAEKRVEPGANTRRLRNYLRMRGEEPGCCSTLLMRRELPPHARRRDCVTCGNFSGWRRFVTLQPIRSRVTTCHLSLLYFCAADQEC